MTDIKHTSNLREFEQSNLKGTKKPIIKGTVHGGPDKNPHCWYTQSQQTSPCPKLTTETIEKGVKYVQS